MQLLEERRFVALRDALQEENEIDIADFLESLDAEEAAVVFRMLKKEMAAEVFSNLSADTQKVIVDSITDQEIVGIIEDLYVDDAVDALEEPPANAVKRILKNAKPETRNLINQFLKYEENTAGSIMTAEFVDLKRGHDRGRSHRTYPPHRRGPGNHLYLLCYRPQPGAGKGL